MGIRWGPGHSPGAEPDRLPWGRGRVLLHLPIFLAFWGMLTQCCGDIALRRGLTSQSYCYLITKTKGSSDGFLESKSLKPDPSAHVPSTELPGELG